MEFINKILENNVVFYSVIGALVVLVLVILYFVFFSKKEDNTIEKYEDQKDEELDKLTNMMKEVEITKEEVEPVKKEEISKLEVSDQEKAKEELQSVIDKMTEDIKVQEVKSYEETEEDAIISYQELLNNVKLERTEIDIDDIYEKEDEIETFDIDDEIETLDVLEETPKNSFSKLVEEVTPVMPKEEVKPIQEKKLYGGSLYKKSEIISPIYGKQNVDTTYPKIESFNKEKNTIEIENTLKLNKDDSNEEFLNSLKEFRRNL